MIFATGGFAFGATSTRSRSASSASLSASPVRTIPTCSPFGPTRRTSGTRMRSLVRASALMWPPRSNLNNVCLYSNRNCDEEEVTMPHSDSSTQQLKSARYPACHTKYGQTVKKSDDPGTTLILWRAKGGMLLLFTAGIVWPVALSRTRVRLFPAVVYTTLSRHVVITKTVKDPRLIHSPRFSWQHYL